MLLASFSDPSGIGRGLVAASAVDGTDAAAAVATAAAAAAAAAVDPVLVPVDVASPVEGKSISPWKTGKQNLHFLYSKG